MKKSIALLLVLVFCLSIAACGTNSSSTPSTAPSSSTPSNSAPATDSTSEQTEVLKIGVLANLTGWFAAIDAGNVNEIKMYVQMINDAGGVKVGDKTYNIELDIQDGQSDFTGIRNAAQILVNNGVKYVLETNDFWVEGALDIFDQAGVMNIETQNNMDLKAIGPDHPYTFTFQNGCASTYVSTIAALKKNYPQVKSVVFCEGDDGMSAIKIPIIKALCEANGLTYVDKPVIFDQSQTDLSAVALQVIATGADAFIGNGKPDSYAALLKNVRASGSQMVCGAVMGFPATALMAMAGPEAATNAFTTGADTTTEANNGELYWKLFTEYKKQYGDEAAASFNSYGINSLYVLTNLMTACKSVEVKDVIAYWDTLKTVDTLYGEATIGGEKIFGNNHLVAAPDPISMLVDGKVVFGGWFPTSLD